MGGSSRSRLCHSGSEVPAVVCLAGCWPERARPEVLWQADRSYGASLAGHRMAVSLAARSITLQLFRETFTSARLLGVASCMQKKSRLLDHKWDAGMRQSIQPVGGHFCHQMQALKFVFVDRTLPKFFGSKMPHAELVSAPILEAVRGDPSCCCQGTGAGAQTARNKHT